MATKCIYDPQTRKWRKVTDTTKEDKQKDKDDSNKETGGTNDDSGLSDSKSSKKTATSKVTKKTNSKTLRALQGSLAVVPTESSIKIKPRDTVQLKGLGNYLSGKYYVESVSRSISSSGYTQTISVLKTNFRKSLKIVAKYPDEKSKLKAYTSIYEKNLSKLKQSGYKGKTKCHTVSKKETLYTISKKYYNTTKKASSIAKVNGNLPKNKWTKLPVGYKLIIK